MSKQNIKIEAEDKQYNIIKINELDVNKVTIGDVREPKGSNQSKAKTKNAPVFYDGKRMYLQIDKYDTPFGANKYNGGNSDDSKDKQTKTDEQSGGKYSMQTAFTADKLNALANMKALDNRMFEIAKKVKKGTWAEIKSDITNNAVFNVLYKQCVKLPKDKTTMDVSDKYPPYMNITIPTKYNKPDEFETIFFNSAGNKLNVTVKPSGDEDSITIEKAIPRQSKCSILLSVSFWCGALGFGLTFKAQQIRIYPSNAYIDNTKCVLGDDDDDEEQEQKQEQEQEQEQKQEQKQEKEKEKEQENEGESDGEDDIEYESESDEEQPPPKVQLPVPDTKTLSKALPKKK